MVKLFHQIFFLSLYSLLLIFPFTFAHLNNESLLYLHLNPNLNQPLSELIPQLTAHVKQSAIAACYDDRLNGKRILLFNENITTADVVRLYYSALPDHTPTNASINHLLGSIRAIVNYVVNECNTKITTNSTSHQNIKLGLTSLSDMSYLELEHLTGSDINLAVKKNPPQPKVLSRSFFNHFLHFFQPKFVVQSYISPSGKGLGNCTRLEAKSKRILPKTWDWRQQGIVTPVRNQITCGSCWAIATSHAVESAWLKAGKRRNWGTHLSVQQILDYDSEADGCEGGSAPTAFEYVKVHGLTDERTYPYVNRQQNRHRHRKRNFPIRARISSYCIRGVVHMPDFAQEKLSDVDIMSELVDHGPLYALVFGEGAILQNYKSGILSEASCPKETNHAVLVVGFDEESWIIKNSWGTRWGENGYFRLARGRNMCGINTEIAYAIV